MITSRPPGGQRVDITTTGEWGALNDRAADFEQLDLRDLFANDPQRAARMTLTVGDLTVDVSKHRVTDVVLAELVPLAERAGLPERI